MDRRLLLCAITVCIGLAGCGGGDDADEAAALAVVQDAYELFNAGDAAWLDVRDRGSSYPSEEFREESRAEGIIEFESEVAGIFRYEDIECESRGLGEWPGIADRGQPVASGYYFVCKTTLTSDAPNATAVPETFNWVVSNGEVVAVNSDD